MQRAHCHVALWWWDHNVVYPTWDHPSQGSARTTLSFRHGFYLALPRNGDVYLELCFNQSFFSSQYITWSWRTRTASPAPPCSPSQRLCHAAPGEPSRKVEDRNWPILDQGCLRLRECCWESLRLTVPNDSEREVTSEAGAL